MVAFEIIAGLWLSNQNSSNNTNFINTNNIEIILNCNKYLNYSSHKYNSPLKEEIEKKEIIHTIKFLIKITEYIYNNLNENKNTLIYCHNNMSISTGVAIAYIMRYGKINKNMAVSSLKTKLSNISVSKILNESLNVFQKYLDRNKYS